MAGERVLGQLCPAMARLSHTLATTCTDTVLEGYM
jgi:hypothetical protein